MSNDTNARYNAASEASFIRSIGRWQETPSMMARLDKLKNYRETLLLRHWDFAHPKRTMPISTREVLLQTTDETIAAVESVA